MSDLKKCEVTGKRCYVSPKQARKMSRHIRNRIRVYTCEHCGYAHITKERHQGSRP